MTATNPITILLVEDDDLFAGMVDKMLVRAGYNLIRASDGRKAMRAYNPHTVDLVLTDLVMPDMEGIELICELRRLHPGVKIIAMSGGGRNRPETLLQPARLLGAVCTLEKPFSNQQLLNALDSTLGRTSNQPAQ